MSRNLDLWEATNIHQLTAVDLATVVLEFMDENRYPRFRMELVDLCQGSDMVEKSNKKLIVGLFESHVGSIHKLQTFFEWKYL